MNTELLISGIIILLGIIGFFYFASRMKYRRSDAVDKIRSKNSDISHYEEMRDELTFRDKIEEVTETVTSKGNGTSLIGGIVSLTLFVIVFVNVFIPVYHTAQEAVSYANVSGGSLESSAGTILQMIPIIAVAGFVLVLLNVFGLGGINTSSWSDDTSKKKEKKMNKNIKHYTNKRDDLTLRKPKIKLTEKVFDEDTYEGDDDES